MSKRTLESFFDTPSKKVKIDENSKSPIAAAGSDEEGTQGSPSVHRTYPFAIPSLPVSIVDALQYAPAISARHLNHRLHLDLLYYEPFIDRKSAHQLFGFLRNTLFFYRVKYKIKRGSVEADINTPRFTTVFGVDETSKWNAAGQDVESRLVERSTNEVVDPKKYACQARPLPGCLETLRLATEAVTGETFNFCLVNYYADGNDSISYHSDDERFLGPKPAIASFTLGSKRDFLMKPKPHAPSGTNDFGARDDEKPLKLSLASGDMVLMRGETQSKWLHSIPKREGGQGDGGRINITFRKALVKGGTENYYQYNVGAGPPYQWDTALRQMVEVRNRTNAPPE